jgi:hypothetical protein
MTVKKSCLWASGHESAFIVLNLFPRLKGGSYEIKWGCVFVCLSVCLCQVKGQRWKKHQWSSDVIATKLSSNQVFSGWDSIQSGFSSLRGVSANQVPSGWEFSQSGSERLGVQPIRCFWCATLVQSGCEELGVQPIRFQGAGSSANQVLSGWEFSQSGFEWLRVQPIRFRGAGSSANQISGSWEFSQSRFERARNSANQVSRSWQFSRSRVEGLGIQPIRFRGAGSSDN